MPYRYGTVPAPFKGDVGESSKETRNMFFDWSGTRKTGKLIAPLIIGGWLLGCGCAWAQSETAYGNEPAARASVWEQIAAPLDKTKAYWSAYWARIGEDHSLKAVLIQSKLYLTYADIDEFTAKDPTQGNIDLQECAYFAKHALYNAQTYWTDGVTKRRLANIVEEINQLRHIPGFRSHKARYARIETHMAQIIAIL
jgi:hypothetical protein